MDSNKVRTQKMRHKYWFCHKGSTEQKQLQLVIKNVTVVDFLFQNMFDNEHGQTAKTASSTL